MKFRDLRPGDRFRFRGRTWRKLSPLRALDEAEDEPRLVARSAQVDAVGDTATRQPAAPPPAEACAAVDTLCDHLRAALREIEPRLDARQVDALARAIDEARAAARAGLDPSRPATGRDRPDHNNRATGEIDR